MKLVLPTDFDILEVMSDSRRQTAPNLAKILDQKRQYMNDRLSSLAGFGLVERVGPSDRSGMYEVTLKGLLVLQDKEQYSHSNASKFANKVEAKLNGDLKTRRERVLDIINREATVDFGELHDLVKLDDEDLEEILEESKSLHLISEAEERSYRITTEGKLVLNSIEDSRSELQGYS